MLKFLFSYVVLSFESDLTLNLSKNISIFLKLRFEIVCELSDLHSQCSAQWQLKSHWPTFSVLSSVVTQVLLTYIRSAQLSGNSSLVDLHSQCSAQWELKSHWPPFSVLSSVGTQYESKWYRVNETWKEHLSNLRFKDRSNHFLVSVRIHCTDTFQDIYPPGFRMTDGLRPLVSHLV